jgi:hypothetical protein
MTAPDRHQHLVQHITYHGRAGVVANHDDLRASVDDPDRRFFLYALTDFPVLAQKFDGLFLAI